MKFFEGRILERLEAGGGEVVIRFPRKSDAKMLLQYINALVDERAKIMMNRRPSIAEEREYVMDCISRCRRGRNVHVVAECGRKIIGNMQLRGGEGTEHYCGEFSMGVSSVYRKLGVASSMFAILERLAKEAGFRFIVSSYYSNNAPSRNFHRRFGFRTVGEIPKSLDYYGKSIGKVIAYKVLR
ncbi:MAG TPA: GNAT family N-acetyltransferase [archaeon]|nr:GNAT family N-acetyltransferase [archaeon]